MGFDLYMRPTVKGPAFRLISGMDASIDDGPRANFEVGITFIIPSSI